LIATNNLTANAESKGAGVGFYMWSGKTQSGTGMSVTGITNTDTGVALDNGAQIINKVASGSASGNLVLTGSTNSTSRAGFGLIMANIENTSANGGIQITASKGDIRANYGQANTIVNAGSGAVVLTAGPSSATDAGAINGSNLTINQNGNGGVIVTTTGTGHVTAPKIINAGTGNVTVAAGTQLAAGTGTGGQVKTLLGNTITQNSTGNTYIYTGNAIDTGALSNMGGFSNGLFLSTIGADTKNAASNSAYSSTIAGGASTQVMFREKVALSGALNDIAITYGGSTDSASVKTALQTANPTTGSDNAISTTAAVGTFKILKADLMADMAAGKPSVDTALSVASNKSTSGNLKANALGYDVDMVSNNYNLNAVSAKLTVAQKTLTIGGITALDKVYNGDAVAAVNTSSVTKTGLVGVDVVNLSNVTGKFRNDANTVDDQNVKLVAGVAAAKTVALSSTYGGADRDNYRITDQATASAVIAQRALTIDAGTVANKTADGTKTAIVTPGALNNLVAGESLGVLVSGSFSDANVGTSKVVTASYTLQNGTNGLASNYILNANTPNPDSRLRGNIFASVNPVVNPTPSPVNNNGVSRVRTVSGFGGAGAATGVLDDQPANESREVCSDLYPENCECQPSVIPTIEICFAPKRVVANKEEK
jgi:hypothetical protein